MVKAHDRPLKVCFVSPHRPMYSLLRGERSGIIGGAEIQQLNLARALRSRGLDVSFIVLDWGQGGEEVLDGFRTIRSYPADGGIRYLRFLQRARSLRRALETADSDIYYMRTRSADVGLASAWCRRRGRTSVFSISHDHGVDMTYLKSATLINRHFYRQGLKDVDAIVVQSGEQREMLLDNHGREGILIRSGHTMRAKPTGDGEFVLWASTLRDWKRPMEFVKLAERLPDIHFLMAGGPGDDLALHEKVRRRANDLCNLDFGGFVPPEDMWDLFSNSTMFVNTSTAEGFPNTFIQSWMCCRPVVSLGVDPDGLVSGGRGMVASTRDELMEIVRSLHEDLPARRKMGGAGRLLVEREMDIEVVADRYITFFENNIKSRTG